jgi:mono/diheme cytochrome c family protein
VRLRVAPLLAPLLAAMATRVGAQPVVGAREPTGRELYVAACAGCHGGDGRGAPTTTLGFTDPPLPDFTDCAYASREAAQDWFAVVHDGGRVRAFSRRMPAFGDALTRDQIARVVSYVRALCRDRSWPRGELNLPRPLVTEKAFPEDESVVTTTVATGPRRAVVTALTHEKRFGARNQWEVVVPVAVRERPEAGGGWTGAGLGDVAVALKRAAWHTESSILTLLGEVVLPTGDARTGFGTGTFVFEPALLAAQTLPANGFVQAHGGLELPANAAKAEREAFLRVAVGTTLQRGFGRAWSPAVELLGARELEGGARATLDLVPQLQVSLARRQHVLASVGARLPVVARAGRPREVIAYLLWDWFDGGLLEAWR